MTRKIENSHASNVGVTPRSVIVGLILMPVNTYFIMANYLTHTATLPTTLALLYNVIITLMLLILFNFLLKRLLPHLALKQGELLTIYIMLSISSALAGHDMMQTIAPTITNAFWYATPENEWQQLFWRYLPSWLVLDDISNVRGFYDGEDTFYTEQHLRIWLRPIFWWTMLLTVLIWVMLCLDVLLRKQWIDRERLIFPIVQLPLQMARSDGWFFKSRMMWLGFAIAAAIDLTNGLHVFFPAFPEFPTRKAEVSQYFTERPWNAVDWTPLYILPFGLGLGFLMSIEISFSLWFFYLFWKGQRVLGTALGLTGLPGFPFNNPQGLGAYLALICFALFGGRRHFAAILRNLFQNGQDDEKEPLRYRRAVFGVIGGLFLLMAFSYKGGMALWIAGLYFLIFYLLSMSIARVRAEVGSPAAEMHYVNPRQFFANVFATRQLPPRSLTVIAMYVAFNRGYRAHPMPHTLEGFKLAEASLMNIHRLFWVMLLATVVGILVAFWAYLDVSYKLPSNPVSGLGNWGYNDLQRWIYHPTSINLPAVASMVVGFLFTGFLWWVRTRFPLWAVHPAGYAITHHATRFAFAWIWFSIFISWGVKLIILKVGGIRLYRKALPFFLGLALGDFVFGGGWALVRLFWNVEVYSFYR